MDDGSFARVDIYEGNENLGLYWELPSIQAFHSVVPASIMEFYPQVDVKRDVSSKPEIFQYPLRPLLSVKWLLVDETEENQNPMPGYTYVDNQYGYNIYMNDCYLPLGFAYDRYLTTEQWELLEEEERDNLLLRAILLDDEAICSNSDLLEPLPKNLLYDTSEEQFYLDVEARQQMSSLGSTFEQNGFTCKTDFDQSRIVFFSVPYSSGWQAWVDDMPAEILKANLGFMAVRVPEGERTVRLEYHTPGLSIGTALSGVSLPVLAGWMIWGKKLAAPAAAQTVLSQNSPEPKEDDHEQE
jgi:uncharacterized membrane protein YfhO